MAKERVKTLSEKVLQELRWAADRVRRNVAGELRSEDVPPPKAASDLLMELPAEGLRGRSGTTIYGEDTDIQKQSDPSGGARTISASRDDTPAAFRWPTYNTEEVPMGGGDYWPTGLLKSGARHLIPGPDHVIGKPTAYGLSAAEEDEYGVLTPGTGTLDLYYLNESTGDLELWTIDGVQQQVDVYTWRTTATTDTDTFLLAHRDRWLKWWVEPSPEAVGLANSVDASVFLTSGGPVRLQVNALNYVTLDARGWEPNAISDEFTCEVAGKYAIRIRPEFQVYDGVKVQIILYHTRGGYTITTKTFNHAFPKGRVTTYGGSSTTYSVDGCFVEMWVEAEVDDILYATAYMPTNDFFYPPPGDPTPVPDPPRLSATYWQIHKLSD